MQSFIQDPTAYLQDQLLSYTNTALKYVAYNARDAFLQALKPEVKDAISDALDDVNT